MNVEKLQFLGTEAILASPRMRELFAQVRKSAQNDATVLLLGEAGTGKEFVARALHYYSPRRQHPFVDLSCGGLPEELIEAELFGHERGAFSGANATRPGLFETAHHGTLFLDEIAQISPRLQAKLLRVLDTKTFYRIGAVKQTKADVRIIASTNLALEDAVAAGSFRQDLYQRLGAQPLRIPPLRERPEEIEALATHFLAQHNPELLFASDALMALYTYRWPGNVRELRNTVLRSALLAKGPLVHADDLIFTPKAKLHGLAKNAAPSQHREGVEGHEPALIRRALKDAGGVRQRAAAALGISRATLNRKMRNYGLGIEETPKLEQLRAKRGL
jgi:DNA-binding NtrC family response regulator